MVCSYSILVVCSSLGCPVSGNFGSSLITGAATFVDFSIYLLSFITSSLEVSFGGDSSF